jgi:hypothetical protein
MQILICKTRRNWRRYIKGEREGKVESGVGKEEPNSRTLGAVKGVRHHGREEQETVPRAGRDRRVVGKEEQEE